MIFWRGWGGALQQAIVNQGYIWFELDNRGVEGRGVEFASHIWRAMGGVEVQDQAAGARFLKTLPEVDPQRIAFTITRRKSRSRTRLPRENRLPVVGFGAREFDILRAN